MLKNVKFVILNFEKLEVFGGTIQVSFWLIMHVIRHRADKGIGRKMSREGGNGKKTEK